MADEQTLRRGFMLGEWEVLPDRGIIRRGEDTRHLEPRWMDVLVCLAAAGGDVVSNDEFVERVWKTVVGDDAIARAVRMLRQSLDDDARSPTFVENIPRRGYRLMVEAVPLRSDSADDELGPAPDVPPPPPPGPKWVLLVGFAAVLIIYLVFVHPYRTAADGSLAVFPFDCAEEDRILCYGFSEELMSKLLEAGGRRVVRSRLPYPKEPGRQTVADEFDIELLVLGRLTRDAENVYVNMEVINRRDGSSKWTRSQQGLLSNVIAIRSRITSEAVEFILGKDALGLEGPSQPASFEALEAYTRGQYEFSVRSRESLERAIEAFQETIRLDNRFGPAYLHLAYAYALTPEYSGAPSSQMYELAVNAVQRGVELDPSVEGPAQSVYGFIAHKQNLWTSAAQAHEKAIASQPVYPISHQLYSRLLASTGRLHASLREAERARQIDPQQAVLMSRLAMAYFWLDDLENAGRYFRQSNDHDEYEAPIHDLAYALFLVRTGQFEQAAAAAAEGLGKNNVDASWIPGVFAAFEDPSKRQDAVDIVAALVDSGGLSTAPVVEITLWALLEEGERAMSVARRLKTEGELFEAELMFIPQFAVLRQHPEFPDLMESIGLTEYWANVGCEFRDGTVVCREDEAGFAKATD